MRIKILTILLVALYTSLNSFAQISTPDKRKFNIGIYDGVGGVNFPLVPLLDVQYKNTILRLAPMVDYQGIGITQEILKLSEVFYNWYWIGSAYYSRRKEFDLYKKNEPTITNRLMGLTGVKVYFGSRFYSQLQIGARYDTFSTPGVTTPSETEMYFEFGLGVNIFKTFLDKRIE